MKELDLIENKTIREKMIGNVSVLEKVKDLLLLGDSEFATLQQVAEYYEVSKQAIESIKNRNKEELINNGMKTFSNKEIKALNIQDECFKIPNRGMILFNKRAILNVGMLLTDSPIAKQVRTLLLDNHEQLNNIHKKLDNGEEITKEDIDKSNPLYFVNREKELRKQEKDLNISLAEAINTGDMNKYMAIDCQKNKIKEDLIALEKEKNELNKPKVEGYDVFINTDNLLSWDTVAKNLGIGRNTLLKTLREHKILQTDKYKYNGKTYTGEHHNVPYQPYMKYFEVKFTTLNNKRQATTKVTADGQAYILKKLKEWKLIA